MKSFTKKVREAVAKIPAGKVLSYGEVARLAGSPQAARAVGAVMRNNFDPAIPCHRVVLSSGVVGEYNRNGSNKKMEILKKEGVKFMRDNRVQMK